MSQLLALTANCHRDPQTPAFQPRQFHPYYLPKKPPKPVSPKEGMAEFRAAMRARQTNG